MDKFNSIIHILEDNSKMKSKKSKEEQVICGRTVLSIIKDTINKNGEILDKENLSDDLDHVMFFYGHAPLTHLESIKEELIQYPDDIVLFKDVRERGIGLYIPKRVLSNRLGDVKSEWATFQDLLTLLQEPYRVVDFDRLICVESKLDLAAITKNLQYGINVQLIHDGATIMDVESTYIDFGVEIGMDTVIYPNTFLKGSTVIGEDCTIGPDARIENTIVGNNTTVKDSTVLDSEIKNDTNVGPYAYVRPNSNIGSGVKIGDFVEIKNANIGDGTKISHLSYVGDADLGGNINIGCGVVFVNYNGRDKNRSTVKDGAFIGCNSNIVAPVVIEELAYVAAGTTVTKNVPSGALAVARIRQENKEGWVKRKNLITEK